MEEKTHSQGAGFVQDPDPQETKEWLDAIHSVIRA